MVRRLVDKATLRERLQHVYWIGGGSCAGKSTVARQIAARYGLQVYATDDAMADHARRTTRNDAPMLHAFLAMDMDQRWLNRSPEAMLETFHWFHGEGFELIVEDLLRLPRERRIVVEGFRLLPRLVEPILADRAHAVWLLPTSEFRRTVVEGRGAAWGFIARTSDPQAALRNLLDRDRMFTERVRDEATRLNLPVIDVDSTVTEADLAGRVARALRLQA